MSDKTSMVLGIIYIIVAIILIVLCLVLVDKHNKKKYEEILRELERNKNLILSGSILTELNKLSTLINNKDLEKSYIIWQNRYKKIKEEDIPDLDDKLNELENLFKTRKFRKINEAIAKLELELYYVKSKSEFLLRDIKEITLSETKNREIITRLKKDYREIYLKYHHNIDDYELIKKAIELQFENVDKLFASFELTMENNAYAEAPKIVKALDDAVGNLKVVIDESPSVIVMGKKLIPEKIADIERISNKLISEGYNLDYLNIDYNISEAEKKIADVFDRLNVLNLTDSVMELETIVNYFDELYNDFEKEKDSKKAYEENARKMGVKCKKLLAIIKNLTSKIEDIKYSYDLNDDEVKIIDELNLNIKSIQSDYEVVVENYRNKSFAYSKLNDELVNLNFRLVKEEDKLELTLRNLSSLKEDEIRAREQLDEIREIFKKCENALLSYKLPVIPKEYYTETLEASDALDNMINELNKKPISIKVLNIRVDTARDLVLKLYKTTTDYIKAARLSENTIVYGNRFRSESIKVDAGLAKAEKEFYKGNYKNSLELAINAVSEADPDIHSKILKVSNK
ncbi:MAG: septation ring formation regulator EzrA [bacterium]|nr:septation ring formation regulator EzrA [bacterium]